MLEATEAEINSQESCAARVTAAAEAVQVTTSAAETAAKVEAQERQRVAGTRGRGFHSSTSHLKLSCLVLIFRRRHSKRTDPTVCKGTTQCIPHKVLTLSRQVDECMSLTRGALAAAERSAADTAKADADRAAIVAKAQRGVDKADAAKLAAEEAEKRKQVQARQLRDTAATLAQISQVGTDVCCSTRHETHLNPRSLS